MGKAIPGGGDLAHADRAAPLYGPGHRTPPVVPACDECRPEIGQIAHLSDEDLLRMVLEDEEAEKRTGSFEGGRAPSTGAESPAPASLDFRPHLDA